MWGGQGRLVSRGLEAAVVSQEGIEKSLAGRVQTAKALRSPASVGGQVGWRTR